MDREFRDGWKVDKDKEKEKHLKELQKKGKYKVIGKNKEGKEGRESMSSAGPHPFALKPPPVQNAQSASQTNPSWPGCHVATSRSVRPAESTS